ncbi:alpha-ketoglutarate-dependent dioxygenase alkB homolog 6 isoform X2 [Sitodiplosis mosellana]|uniref:alpha-ketoglutarate-dependent dioxygenase alkB homolog 6 isoform X2 n=1 Tax=Sitodiplosis mosellana TaxID=263140 RepID=UPI0024450B3E|nr:alpha-ketoglutarate-dependent dioxygenase alkB homolog 6 isoform X2 [Sitodiplosis mosellana]
MDFTRFKCPPSVFYIPSFLSEQEEESILRQIENTPKPKWTQLSNRRLINYGGVPHKNGMIAEELPNWLKDKVAAVNNIGIFNQVKANHVLVNEYLPGQGIMAHSDGPLFHPVICTISCGSHTILRFHETDSHDADNDGGDGDGDNNRDTAMIPTNCGDITIDQRCKLKHACQLLIEPRSLLILKDDMYKKYLHSIANETHDIITPDLANLEQCCDELKNRVGGTVERNRRISLTIRHVPKTSRIHLRLGH